MSRLTIPGAEKGKYNVAYAGNGKVIDKLGRYEDLGKPNELVKVVRCRECAEYEADDSKKGVCESHNRIVYATEYCSRGRKKEATHD